MKKISVLAIVMLFAVSSFAQNMNVQTAYNYLKKGKLKDALEAIEPALEHAQTSGQAKTWFYYGNTCFEIANTKNPEYQNLLADPFDDALTGYTKTQELDKRGEYKDQVTRFIYSIAMGYYQKGIETFEKQTFGEAADYFNKSFKINKEQLAVTDTLALYYAATSYLLGKDYDNAEKLFLQLKEMDYNQPDIYFSLAKIALEKKDNAKALGYIDEGLSKFPNNVPLLQETVNLYLSSEELFELKKDQTVTILEKLIQLDEENLHIYYYDLGVCYASRDIEKAAEMYKKALEVKPDYANAYINWANIYVEKSNAFVREANELPIDEDKKYNELVDKSKELLNEALPYMEKAYELTPDDISIRQALRDLYIKLNMLDKAETIK